MHSVKSKTSRLSGPPHSLGHNNFPARHMHSSTAAQHRDNVQAWVADDREDDDLSLRRGDVPCVRPGAFGEPEDRRGPGLWKRIEATSSSTPGAA
jgi:hypothetical protein